MKMNSFGCLLDMELIYNQTHPSQCRIGHGKIQFLLVITKFHSSINNFFLFLPHRFKQFAKLEKKSDESLSDYYKVFIAMCKQQAGEKLLEEEKGLEGLIDDIGEDHAKLILDRLELLSKLREMVKNPKLEERLKLCENNLDTPDWWESGKHDRELIRAVLNYGLYRSDQLILNDPDFPFAEAERNYMKSLEVLKSFKFDNPADLFKLAMGETPTKVETKEEITPTKSEERIVEKPDEGSANVEEISKETATEIPCDEKDIVEKSGEISTSAKSESEEKLPASNEAIEHENENENKTTPDDVPADDKKKKEPETSTDSEKVDENMEVDETPVQEIPMKENSGEKMELDNETSKTPDAIIEEGEKSSTEEIPKVDDERSEQDLQPLETDEKIVQDDENKDKSSDEKSDEKSTEDKSAVEEDEKIEEGDEKEKEKDEIEQADDEKPEPKIDDVVDKTATSIEKSPEKVESDVAAIESTEQIIKPEDIKTEPGFERSGEPKIIDTVVIDDDDTMPEKPSSESTEKKSSSAVVEEAPTRPQLPDLEAFQPLMKLKQLDAMMMKGDMKDSLKSLARVFDTSMVVKWFRDFALEKRISHIIYCVEKGAWPVGKSFSAYSGCLGIDLDLPLHETVKRANTSDDKRSSSNTPDIITITTDHQLGGKSSLSALQSQLHQSMSALTKQSKKGQKRHIAIDVETERAKLHALLNNSSPLGPNAKANWHEDEQELRRSGGSLQPPPAHQPSSRSAMAQYKPTVIPGTSSTLTPIDLSSR